MSSIRHIRMAMGLSQKAFASLLGINRSRIAMYERGLRSLPIEVVTKAHELYSQFLNQAGSTSDPDLQLLIQQIDESIRLEINARKVAEEQKLAYLESRLQLLITEKKQLENSLVAVSQILAQTDVQGLAKKRQDLIQEIGKLNREADEVGWRCQKHLV